MPFAKHLKITLSHFSFSLLFTAMVYVICNVLLYEKIAKWFLVGEILDVSG